jgi:hypothetical protein
MSNKIGLLSIPETARLLGHCRNAIRSLIDEGKLRTWTDRRGRIWVSRASIRIFKQVRLEDLERRLKAKLAERDIANEIKP